MCVVKKISVLCFVISFGIAYPMKRSLEPGNKDQCVTFKSLKGFPLTSINKGQQWFSLLSKSDRNSVTKNIINHKDERLNTLFNIATKFVPAELKKAIAQRLYKDEHVKAFLHMPIAQAYCYEGFLDIINDEKNSYYFKRWCSQDPHFKPDIICHLAKEITVFDECLSNNHLLVNKKKLEAIAKIVEAFEDSFSKNSSPMTCCHYEYYEPLTIKKFIKEDLRYLPFFLSVFITLALPWCDICGIDEKNVRDEHRYCLSPFVSTKIISWLSVWVPLLDCFALINSTPTLKAKDMIGPFAAGMIFYKFVESIASLSVEQPIMGASCVTGWYLLACCVNNVAKPLKYDCVSIKKLPALLQRRDIRIV